MYARSFARTSSSAARRPFAAQTLAAAAFSRPHPTHPRLSSSAAPTLRSWSRAKCQPDTRADAATATATPPSAPKTKEGSSSASPAQECPFKHAYLIFNPAAGQENPASILGDIALKLSACMKLTVLQTQPDTSPQDLAKQALDEGADVVLVSGGDGTVGAVAGALVDTGIPMGIIPRGTANAFSMALGIPTHLDDPLNFAVQAADVILQGHTIDVDTALVNTSEVTDYPMILLLGIGYEAETVAAADRDLKDALGPLAYVVSGVQNLVGAKNFQSKVVVDGEVAEGEVAAITIANAAPPFSVLAHGHTGECIYDDGKLEAIGYVAAEGGVVSPLVNAVNMVRLFTGIMFSDKPVQSEDRIFGGRYKDITVECDPPQKVVLDGELLGETPVHARVKPASLKVIVPPPPPPSAEEAEAAAAEAEDEGAPAGEESGEDDDDDGTVSLQGGNGKEEGDKGSSSKHVNEEGNGAASRPDSEGTVAVSPLVEASAQVEDKPIVAHKPNSSA